MNAANIQLAAAGRAYQSVAQSAAIAIQDATDYLRSINTISSTAAGIGIAMVIAGKKPEGIAVITQAAVIATAGVAQFTAVTTAAVAVASSFPQAFTPKSG
jgi:hypothetical protein